MARELSNAPDRLDRPGSAAEAQQRFESFLEQLSATTPRAGLAAATAAFVHDLVRRASRYGSHLFQCFDDPRIPATTNDLEGNFGEIKRVLRHTLGCGSTTNSITANLGAEILIAFHQVRRDCNIGTWVRDNCSPEDFSKARDRIACQEAPAILQRSRVRNLQHHLDRLRRDWLQEDGATERNA